MKANYSSIPVYENDLKDIQRLADKVERTLLSANGYYFEGWDEESRKILKTDNLRIIIEVQKILNERHDNES